MPGRVVRCEFEACEFEDGGRCTYDNVRIDSDGCCENIWEVEGEGEEEEEKEE